MTEDEKKIDSCNTSSTETGHYSSNTKTNKTVVIESEEAKHRTYKPYDSLRGRVISLKNFKQK